VRFEGRVQDLFAVFGHLSPAWILKIFRAVYEPPDDAQTETLAATLREATAIAIAGWLEGVAGLAEAEIVYLLRRMRPMIESTSRMCEQPGGEAPMFRVGVVDGVAGRFLTWTDGDAEQESFFWSLPDLQRLRELPRPPITTISVDVYALVAVSIAPYLLNKEVEDEPTTSERSSG
jgi:hypothetical protein